MRPILDLIAVSNFLSSGGQGSADFFAGDQ